MTRILLLAAIAGAMSAASAHAATFYTDAGAFNAAATGLVSGNLPPSKNLA
jgi:hypothetical protein